MDCPGGKGEEWELDVTELGEGAGELGIGGEVVRSNWGRDCQEQLGLQ